MKFTKLQGAGNDFVLIEAGGMEQDWSELAKAMCDRHFGVGADGLLLLLPSDKADIGMRIFNSDGSEAETCGNGIRCLLRYVVDKGLVAAKPDGVGEISIENIDGIRKAKLHQAGGRLTGIQVNMGTPEFKAEDIPVALEPGSVDIKSMISYAITIDGRELQLNLVSMGNPHAVYFEQNPVSGFPLSRIGPEVEHYKIFPERTNFEVARVINRHRIEARVWERGAGETLACGSGACAIAVAARTYDYIDNQVSVELPGGTLAVEWNGVGEVSLSGPAEIVCTGEWLSK